MVKFMKIAAIVIGVAYIAAIIGVRLMERSLVYQPGARPVDIPDAALALKQQDVTFFAADSTRLAAWIILSGEAKRLEPIGEVVRDYIDSVERSPDGAAAAERVHERVTSATLFVTMAALGDAIIGNPLRRMVGRERDAVRKVIGALLPLVIEGQKP